MAKPPGDLAQAAFRAARSERRAQLEVPGRKGALMGKVGLCFSGVSFYFEDPSISYLPNSYVLTVFSKS